jgi:hypothetical protein
MTLLENRSLFAAELFAFPDTEGQEISLLVVVATFEVNENGGLEPITPQPPVRVADEHFGDPALSSVRYEADVALKKHFVDMLVNGSAHAPKGRPARSVTVGLYIGDIHKKLVVHGDRKSGSLLTGRAMSIPKPFVTMPIVYERAYGGTDTRASNPKRHKIYRWNPIGVGYRGIWSQDPSIQTHVPNIEYAGHRPKFMKKGPAGFGVIGRSWSPRLEFAGTYDQQWIDTQWPLFPTDFDVRHYQSAPADQQSKTIRGGEEVRLLNMTPGGEWRFRLPSVKIPVRLLFDDREIETSPRLDTVIIEPDIGRLMLTYRVAMAVERNRPPLREIILDNITRLA